MHSAKINIIVGLRGVVFDVEVVVYLVYKIALRLSFFPGQCVGCLQSLRCGIREWSVSSLDLRYPELFACGAGS